MDDLGAQRLVRRRVDALVVWRDGCPRLAAINAHARAAGLRAHMRLANSRALVPDLITAPRASRRPTAA